MSFLSLQPIVPSGPITDARTADKIELLMRQWATAVQNRLQSYPAQTTYSGAQSLGKNRGARTSKRHAVNRKPYRRTMRLAGGWHPTFVPGTAIVSNPVDYAGYVEGYKSGSSGQRQTSVMSEKSWPRIDEVGQQEWDAIQGLITDILTQRQR